MTNRSLLLSFVLLTLGACSAPAEEVRSPPPTTTTTVEVEKTAEPSQGEVDAVDRFTGELPACPSGTAPVSKPATNDEAPAPSLADKHPFDGDPRLAKAFRALTTKNKGVRFPALVEPGHDYDSVRKLLQPPIELPEAKPVELNDEDRRILAELDKGDADKHETAMMALLHELVSINSQSGNDEGTAAVRRAVSKRLEPLGFVTEHDDDNGVTLARLRPKKDAVGKKLLLIGHTDTVLPPSAFTPMLCRDGEEIHGSGVVDMKGGLVVLVATLEALHRSGDLDGRHITVLLNSDEEIGSTKSRAALAEQAGLHELGMSFEGGKVTDSAGGGLTLARKGIVALKITVNGESAHSGVAHYEGVDAGRIAARIIESLGWIVDYRKGLTVNVGRIETNDNAAGNRVLQQVTLHGEIRYWDPKQRDDLVAAVETLVAGSMVCNPYVDKGEKVCSTYEITTRGRPPSPQTRERGTWFAEIAALSRSLGTEVKPVASGGASDMNLAIGLDMLDSFGPIGTGLHSLNEKVRASTFLMRARLAALVIDRTAR